MNPEQSPMVEKEVKHTPLTNDEEALRRAFDGSRLSIYTTESSAPVMRDFLWFIDTLRPLKSQLSSLQEENEGLSRHLHAFNGIAMELADQSAAKFNETISTQSKRIEELTGENERLESRLSDELRISSQRITAMVNLEEENEKLTRQNSRLTGEVERLRVLSNQFAAMVKESALDVIRLREALTVVKNSFPESVLRDQMNEDFEVFISALSNSSTTKE
jgi:hypothetical protein